MCPDFKSFNLNAIRKWVEENRRYNDEKVIGMLCGDSRNSVRNFGTRLLNNMKKNSAETERLHKMLFYEKKFSDRIVGGCDEAGRGPLCGPVVAAVVILPENPEKFFSGLNDSKQISEKKRNELFDIIMEKAICAEIGISDNDTIDEINILNATCKAAEKAFLKLKIKPEILITDYLKIEGIKTEQIPLVKGDSKSLSVAAASVIAKVTRDRIMDEYHKKYPQYGFDRNKGYGTKEHIKNLKKYGAVSIHRKTFIKNFIDLD